MKTIQLEHEDEVERLRSELVSREKDHSAKMVECQGYLEKCIAAKEIIDTFPKTADGVPIVVHEKPTLFVYTRRKVFYLCEIKVRQWDHKNDLLTAMIVGSHVASFRPGDCYSSREACEAAEAAEAAKEIIDKRPRNHRQNTDEVRYRAF